MARTQTLVQLSEELLARLDERAAREGRSRSALLREAAERYLADDVAAATDRRIVDGYRRRPQEARDDAWAVANARAAVRDQPW
jgi:metal-responsive CopG/Arc/MetJ family transcriptional regulator